MGEWPWLLGLFAVGLLSRWATRSQLVQAWDAGHFVLALDGLALPSVHFPAYDHDQADFRLDQQGPTIAVRPPLRRLVVLDRGLRMEPPALAGVRDVMVLPGRLRLLEVPIPPDGLEVERGAIRALPPPADARDDQPPS